MPYGPTHLAVHGQSSTCITPEAISSYSHILGVRHLTQPHPWTQQYSQSNEAGCHMFESVRRSTWKLTLPPETWDGPR
eukprot:16282-Eustigmatos_ZCMA.PRE.1